MTKKKRILFIAPYPFNEAPSQRFRFEQYFDFLKQNDFILDFKPFLNLKTWHRLYQKGNTIQKIIGISSSFTKRLIQMLTLYKYDYVFIHREASHIGPPIFEWIITKIWRKKYIYDFDDAIWIPNFSQSNAKFQKLKNYKKVNLCMKWAHQISAGNAFLAEYASQFNSNTVIIPTTIDMNYHIISKDQKNLQKPVIGWTGTHTTLRYLDVLIPILKELETKYNFDFLIISNETPTYNLNSLKFIKWNKKNEIQDLNRISIGVMPLVKDKWSEGKCGFKGLQYMSIGIPSLMSPVGVNTEIIEHGKNGFLLNTPEEWKQCLIQLLENPGLRETIGLAGKKTIKDKYSVEANKKNYLNLFQ